MSAAQAAGDVLASVVRQPVRVAREVRDEAVGIVRDAEVAVHGQARAPQNDAGLPSVSWAWFAGLATVTALGALQPEVAALLAVAHLVERRVHNQEVAQLVGGLEEGI